MRIKWCKMVHFVVVFCDFSTVYYNFLSLCDVFGSFMSLWDLIGWCCISLFSFSALWTIFYVFADILNHFVAILMLLLVVLCVCLWVFCGYFVSVCAHWSWHSDSVRVSNPAEAEVKQKLWSVRRRKHFSVKGSSSVNPSPHSCSSSCGHKVEVY